MDRATPHGRQKVFLFDILHPAHVHFFRNAVRELEAAGHRVRVTARDKDITLRLLDLYGIRYEVISREARSKRGLAVELARRNLRLLRIVRRERPEAMASIGGVTTAQVGFLTRVRNYIFYDTEHANLSNLISYPFATEVVTPDCYAGRVLGRHVTYPGYHELAYLHPDRFQADAEVLRQAGVAPDEPYSVMRFVSWKAVHDVGARGLSLAEKHALVTALAKFGRVFISSEEALPASLAEHRLPVSPDQVHHLLAFARLFVGESATMASESVVLGTPAIYVDPTGRGYTDEQQRRYGLCFNFHPEEAQAAIRRAEAVLAGQTEGEQVARVAHARLLADKVDVTSLIVSKLLGA